MGWVCQVGERPGSASDEEWRLFSNPILKAFSYFLLENPAHRPPAPGQGWHVLLPRLLVVTRCHWTTRTYPHILADVRAHRDRRIYLTLLSPFFCQTKNHIGPGARKVESKMNRRRLEVVKTANQPSIRCPSIFVDGYAFPSCRGLSTVPSNGECPDAAGLVFRRLFSSHKSDNVGHMPVIPLLPPPDP
jgi:hypothetical protein